MKSSRKFFNTEASSLLESVLALTLISICLYISIMVYSAVFTPRTSPGFYNSQNKADEYFFVAQLQQDSLLSNYDGDQWNIEEEENEALKKLTVRYADSSKVTLTKTFYINK